MVAIPGTCDDFNRADVGPPPSFNWGKIASGAAEFQIVSNKATIPTGSGTDAWLPAGQIAASLAGVVVGTSCVAGGLRLYTRMTNINSPTYKGYALRVSAGSSDIQRYDSGSGTATTIAGPNGSFSMVDGEMWYLLSIGGTHEGWRKPPGGSWTLMLAAVDNTYPSGYIGMGVSGDTVYAADEFFGGLVAAGDYPLGRTARSRRTSW